ncbi:MAG: ATP-binding protein [Bacteroidota bacterium]
MELSRARKLIAQGEGETIEFKRKVAHPDKIIKELVAFANTSGGHLFIGVNDDGSIPGVRFPEDEIFALNKAIEQYCRPTPEFQIDTVHLSEKKSLVRYFVPSGQKRLYTLSSENEKHRLAYVRYADKSIKASREVQEILRRRHQNKNIKFHFGDKEKLLMEYLEHQKIITLEEYRKRANLNYYKASKTLIILVLANVLGVIPNDKGDQYYQRK